MLLTCDGGESLKTIATIKFSGKEVIWMYAILSKQAIFKKRYGQWYFIDTKQRERERFHIGADSTDLVFSLLQGMSITDVAREFEIAKGKLLSFLRILVKARVIEFTDKPSNSMERCFFTSPPLDSINILITNACNLKCKHCYLESGKCMKNELTGQDWIDVLEQARKLGAFELNVSGGEPLLHKDFCYLAEYIASVPTFNANLNTNGTLIREKHLLVIKRAFNSVQISLDDFSSKEHDFFRGRQGSFKNSIRAIKQLVACDIETNVAFTLNQKNSRSLNDIADLCEGIGVTTLNIGLIANIGRAYKKVDAGSVAISRTKFKLWIKDLYTRLLDLAERKSRLKILLPFRLGDDDKQIREKRYICSGDSTQIVYIMADGTIMPCDKLPKKLFSYGNVREQTLKEVWLSKKMKEFKLKSPRQLPKCRNCSYLQFCGGACVARAFCNGGSLEAEDQITCLMAKKFAQENLKNVKK